MKSNSLKGSKQNKHKAESKMQQQQKNNKMNRKSYIFYLLF